LKPAEQALFRLGRRLASPFYGLARPLDSVDRLAAAFARCLGAMGSWMSSFLLGWSLLLPFGWLPVALQGSLDALLDSAPGFLGL